MMKDPAHPMLPRRPCNLATAPQAQNEGPLYSIDPSNAQREDKRDSINF